MLRIKSTTIGDDCVAGGRLCRLADCTGWPTVVAGRLFDSHINNFKLNSVTQYGRPCATVGHPVKSTSRYSRPDGAVSDPVYSVGVIENVILSSIRGIGTFGRKCMSQTPLAECGIQLKQKPDAKEDRV
uniref:Uncharacterized protein n=1 Tax=Romanomermis culicivorax TaxID=13658 RepID=A0A915JJZ3_ROMCU